jgi:hypothetical protein
MDEFGIITVILNVDGTMIPCLLLNSCRLAMTTANNIWIETSGREDIMINVGLELNVMVLWILTFMQVVVGEGTGPTGDESIASVGHQIAHSSMHGHLLRIVSFVHKHVHLPLSILFSPPAQSQTLQFLRSISGA